MRCNSPRYYESLELLEGIAKLHPLGKSAYLRLEELRVKWRMIQEAPEALVLTPFSISTAVEMVGAPLLSELEYASCISFEPTQLPQVS